MAPTKNYLLMLWRKDTCQNDRAEGCDVEYEQTAFAFKTLIGPYIDRKLAKKVLATWMRDVSARPYPRGK